nr:MAG TPA: hypothetical protein [Caudoviricetes sp.]
MPSHRSVRQRAARRGAPQRGELCLEEHSKWSVL